MTTCISQSTLKPTPTPTQRRTVGLLACLTLTDRPNTEQVTMSAVRQCGAAANSTRSLRANQRRTCPLVRQTLIHTGQWSSVNVVDHDDTTSHHLLNTYTRTLCNANGRPSTSTSRSPENPPTARKSWKNLLIFC